MMIVPNLIQQRIGMLPRESASRHRQCYPIKIRQPFRDGALNLDRVKFGSRYLFLLKTLLLPLAPWSRGKRDCIHLIVPNHLRNRCPGCQTPGIP